MPPARVRPATADDLPQIEAILRDSPIAPQWSSAEFAEILAASGTGEYLLRRVWMAEDAGFAVATVLRSVYPAEAELESIAVAPAARGRGVGAALVETIAAWAAGLGADALRLEVRAGNDPALRLYLRSGFRRTGVRPRYYSHPEEDAVCMERTISPKGNT